MVKIPQRYHQEQVRSYRSRKSYIQSYVHLKGFLKHVHVMQNAIGTDSKMQSTKQVHPACTCSTSCPVLSFKLFQKGEKSSHSARRESTLRSLGLTPGHPSRSRPVVQAETSDTGSKL